MRACRAPLILLASDLSLRSSLAYAKPWRPVGFISSKNDGVFKLEPVGQSESRYVYNSDGALWLRVHECR